MSRTFAVIGAALVGALGAAGAVAFVAARDDGASTAPSATDAESSLRDEVETAVENLRDTTVTTVAGSAQVAATRSERQPEPRPDSDVVTTPPTSEASEPEPPSFLAADPATCPAVGHAAVIDRANQLTWLCDDGSVTREMPMTSARSQPDPGTYEVYAKDLNASSTFTGRYSEMTHFVAFTYGKYQGARIAYHSVPTYPDGSYVQPLDSVGSTDRHGDSSGCIRVLPDDAVLIWDWLAVGDPVVVIS